MIIAKSQTTIEAVIMIILVAVVFLGMQGFLRRAVQGQWKSNIDTISDEQWGNSTETSTLNPEIKISSDLRIDVMKNVANSNEIYGTARPNITAPKPASDPSSQIVKIDGWGCIGAGYRLQSAECGSQNLTEQEKLNRYKQITEEAAQNLKELAARSALGE